MRRPARLVRFLLTAGLTSGLVLVACHQYRTIQPNSPAALAETRARLEGNWTLSGFEPERPLEPTLDALLKAQLGVMTVEIRGDQLAARSGGLLVVRRLDVVESNGDDFRAQLRDDQGLAYGVSGEIGRDWVRFTSLNDPWRGRGELRRAE